MGWILNEGPSYLILIIWLGINVGLFAGYYIKFDTEKPFFYTTYIMGKSLPLARASAACLNFNCLLILLPVCRNLISFLRSSIFCKFCKRNVRRQLDNNLTFHKACAYMICLQTGIHYFSHCYNFEHLLKASQLSSSNQLYNYTTLSAKQHVNMVLSNLPTEPNGTWLNPINAPDTNPMLEVLKSVAGISGAIITLCLIIMVSSSTEMIRRSYFELFWFTHHLFVVFFFGLVIHALGGIVKSQSNVVQHDPVYCVSKVDKWGKISECRIPQFQSGVPQTWKWVLAPMVIYTIERIIRIYRNLQTVVITEVVKHPSRVVEIRMTKEGFRMDPGQYVFLKCNQVSRLEWHPFTLTSAPDDDYFSVHIRTVGDWTTELAKRLGALGGDFQKAEHLPRIAVDGPFGTASDDVSRYQVAMLVAAGIGVTPFASVLKDLSYRIQEPAFERAKLTKVYFIWICPETNAFEWFADLLKVLEDQLSTINRPHMLTYNIYLTRGWNRSQVFHIMQHEEDAYDVVTGLRQKTHYGRPNWDQIFKNTVQEHSSGSVGVFFCGPEVLSKTLQKMCNKYSGHDSTSTRFFFNKENF